MIVFDLRCSRAHVFEAWFGSSAAFEDQQARSLLACPVCGDAQIIKAAMAPNVGAKGNSRAEIVAKPQTETPPSPQAFKAALHALAKVQAKALENSQWVGRAFADRARAMHVGELPSAPIHGEATSDEAAALIDEGVAVAPLPLPVVPPDAIN